jgi:hypothetical protein
MYRHIKRGGAAAIFRVVGAAKESGGRGILRVLFPCFELFGLRYVIDMIGGFQSFPNPVSALKRLMSAYVGTPAFDRNW